MEKIRLNTEQTVIWHNPASIFKYNGWPSICRDDRGTLYVTASSFRIQHVDPTGKNAMWISPDEGKTWSKPMIINDSRLDDRDTGIISLGGGHMIATWFSEYSNVDETNPGFKFVGVEDREMILGFKHVYNVMRPEDLIPGAYVMVSDDYGFTWSDPIRVPMTAPHGANRMNDGRAVYLGKDDHLGEGKVRCYISSDYGRTWEHKGDVPLPEGHRWSQFHEPHVVQLPNGRLLGAIRVHERPTYPIDSCYITHSDDEGKTWSVPEFIGVEGLPPHLLVHSSGAVILSYNDRMNTPKNERARVSYDGGETWEQEYIIDDKNTFCDLGYPATAELSDGSLFTVYYQARPNENFPCIMGSRWELQK